ncbi:MAG: hypothetical protein KC933_23780, partial [Myxococcales bacterium]|nr:hypothetical protein [Myxococcales bacterium]
ADACPRTAHPFAQPLALEEDSGLPRYPAVIGFPMAFPRGGGLRSLTGFSAVTLDGETLATQGEVLSRWGDGPQTCEAPIRWAYFFTAAQPPPGQRAYVSLKHQPGQDPAPPVHLTVDEDPKRVVVDTGVARFTVQRDWFNGLSKVEVKVGERYETVADGTGRADAGMLVLHRSQLASTLHGKVLSFEVERAGPVVATVAVKGTYAFRGQGQYYRYTLRLHFYAGSGAVQLDHTYYNGEVENSSAEGAKNRKVSDRVFFRLPLTLGGEPVVQVRGNKEVHGVSPTDVVSVAQDKRTPERPAPVFAVTHGAERLELGAFADHPFIAALGQQAYAVATIGLMGIREPQALRYDPKARALELDWQSEEVFIGGAKGIWSKAALDFGPVAAVDAGVRASQLQAHVTRPLIAVPNPAYLNTTHAYGPLPSAALPSGLARLDKTVDQLHANTVQYLRKYRITGAQLWPDLKRDACSLDDTCKLLEEGFFEGGDNNYWDWSLVELEQFLRTADPVFLHDFALGEATTMAETVSFRPNWYDKSKESVFAGQSPCYGTARGWGGPWVEGLSHRTGNCPGDYGYNKVHRLAYILTGDRRFTDFFTDGANTALRQYGTRLRDKVEDWRELSPSRMTSQYFEPLLTAAEFGRIGGDAENRRFRDQALAYFDFMKDRALERGHSCSLLGSGHNTPGGMGQCNSAQQWMMPIFVDWVLRLFYLYDHAPAREWLLAYVKQSTLQTTVLDGDGLPDIDASRASDGWRTLYTCKANGKSGVLDDTCKRITDYENQAYYYANGMVAYLNALGMVGEVDPQDSLQLCKWWPEAAEKAMARMDNKDLNELVWGKSPAQAFAFSQRAMGALERCWKK